MKDFLHKLFIPKASNNFRAKALHINFLTIYLILALLLTVVVKQYHSSDILGVATDITTSKLFELTNSERTHNHLTPLAMNDKLNQAAAKKAQDMFQKNYWAHFGPHDETPWDFILASGYKYEYAGENLAKNFLFSKGVVDAWMNSKTHRENLLRPEYTEVGFASVNGIINGEETTLVVQMFGKPLQGKTIGAELPQQSSPNVLSKTTNASLLPRLTYDINLLFIGFILLVLSIDFYIASKHNLLRVHGKNLAHFIFLAFMLVGLILITKGAII